MTYELAKELKDAGLEYGNHLHRAIKFDGSFRTIGEESTEEMVLEPTLEELIDACQPYFWDLVCNVGIQRGNEILEKAEWVANARVDNKTESGPTPTEAVARLWLALNKK